jgi:DNA mismatch repair protein MutL
MKVRVLPDHVANQIAAGEVVDRPAAIVRELVDNALDAGATDIAVFLENGGHASVRVVDDGCGMTRDDALLAFERHATSKIAAAEDLQTLATLGFRGEALPSIASVSKIELITRERESATATRLLIEGGQVRRVEGVAAPVGTSFEVRSLFYNTPARKKFLKQPKTEEQRIKQWLSFVSIPHPGVRFRLTSDGREVLNLARRESSIERGVQFFKGSTVPFESTRGEIAVRGRVGHPALAEASTQSFATFVNGRLVSDRGLLRAVKEGFDSTLKEREFPIGFLLVELPPGDVDVNVHPQKSEIRLRTPHDVFLAVKEGVMAAVREFRGPAVIPSGTGSGMSKPWDAPRSADRTLSAFDRPPASALQLAAPRSSVFPTVIQETPPIQATMWGSSAPALTCAPLVASFRYTDLRYVGLILECYLICQHSEKLYVVDMHAAHERCNYNRVRQQYRDRAVNAQQLLVPFVVELSEIGLANCLEQSEIFRAFGFEVDAFGDSALVVRSVPVLFGSGDIAALIKEVAALTSEDDATGRFEERIDHIAARIACHASIRSGETMTREEAYALLADLDQAELSGACPHGRPVIVSFDRVTVEQWFGRDR